MQDIHNIIAVFANSLDLKDWRAFGSILAEQIECDYRDLRGTVETLTREAFVQKRIEALQPLKTQHLFTNLHIESREEHEWCRANALIIRQLDNKVFHTHAIYEFKIHQRQIVAIKQTVLWNEGDGSIHAGVKNAATKN